MPGMRFLNLWALWIAAVVIPALLILYFLKLRRREQPISSTLLWKRAVQDLQVNAPFQRLRKNLLLLLQLLILALAILALARPIVQTTIADEERVVILIDRSASMNAREGRETRLKQAKDQAIRLVRTLNRRTGGWRSFFSLAGAPARTQVMVIAFSDRATVVSPFTPNTGDLEDLIRHIEPTDGRTELGEALKLAEAYMAPPTMLTPGMEGTPVTAESPARLVLISDGRIADLERLVVKSGTLTRIPIGQSRDNVGITALRTQRSYERPEQLSVYLSVRNYGPQPVTTDVGLYVDGTLATARSVTLAGKADADESSASAPVGESDPGGVSLSFELPLDRAAVLEARVARDDALAADNTAWAIIPPPRKLRVLVVSEKNLLLDSVLAGLPLLEYPFIRPAEWEANPQSRYESDGHATFDVVIFDKYQPRRLPGGNYLFLGTTPAWPELTVGEPLSNFVLIWWDETHPVLRHVALEYVQVGESLTVRAPEQAEVLADGPKGPVLLRYAREGRNCLILTFPIERSTWWFKQSYAIFMYNAIRYMGGGGSEVERGPIRPGEPLRIPAAAGAERLRLLRPDGTSVVLTPDMTGIAYFSGTERVGVYRVEDGVPGRDRFAVNLEDEWESDITPAKVVRMADREVQDTAPIRTATPEVWRWFVGAALVLVLVEWWVYNRRVMI